MKRAGWIRATIVAIVGVALTGAVNAAGGDKVPYWASISAREAMMRTGPGPNYPAVWKYTRPGLPVKVTARHEHWRRVVEQDGTEGWMNGVLLSDDRTGVVIADPGVMRDAPDASARILWRAARGVIGKISHCAGGWCQFEVTGRTGYIEIAQLWGVDSGETVN
jgi:SH3-like domain-containing protein